MKSELVDIEGELVHETELAYLFYDGKTKDWIPKSQCEWDGETMTMPRRLAKEKGFV